MAFAIASGVARNPACTVPLLRAFLISALGGSRCQIGGPTGAFVVVVAGIIAKYGVDGLMMCTLMAGVLLIVLGITGLGTVIQFIPRPVVIGFTNGIAVLIAKHADQGLFWPPDRKSAGRVSSANGRRSLRTGTRLTRRRPQSQPSRSSE